MTMAGASAGPDGDMLDRFQRAAFGYFVEHFNSGIDPTAETNRAGIAPPGDRVRRG